MFLGRKGLVACAAVGLGVLSFGIGAGAYYAGRQASNVVDDTIPSLEAKVTEGPDVVFPTAPAELAAPDPSITTETSSSTTPVEPPTIEAKPDADAPPRAAPTPKAVAPPPQVDTEASAPAPPPAAEKKPSTSIPGTPPPPQVPDLAIIDMSLSPSNIARGQTITSSIRGINRGTATAKNVPVRIDVQYQAIGRWVTLANLSRSIDSLAPGEEISIERSAAVPREAPPGRYRVVVTIDPDRTIAGASTQDGQRTLEFVVQ